jgi:predicted metal-dependent hydrolase
LGLNTLLKHLPQDLIEYIVYHEITHAKTGRKHDRNFWNTIDKKFENHQTREKDLLTYWFIVQEKARK